MGEPLSPRLVWAAQEGCGVSVQQEGRATHFYDGLAAEKCGPLSNSKSRGVTTLTGAADGAGGSVFTTPSPYPV